MCELACDCAKSRERNVATSDSMVSSSTLKQKVDQPLHDTQCRGEREKKCCCDFTPPSPLLCHIDKRKRALRHYGKEFLVSIFAKPDRHVFL